MKTFHLRVDTIWTMWVAAKLFFARLKACAKKKKKKKSLCSPIMSSLQPCLPYGSNRQDPRQPSQGLSLSCSFFDDPEPHWVRVRPWDPRAGGSPPSCLPPLAPAFCSQPFQVDSKAENVDSEHAGLCRLDSTFNAQLLLLCPGVSPPYEARCLAPVLKT